MDPCSPVMPGSAPIELVYGEGQDPYIPLPAVYVEAPNSRVVVSRWRLTDEERATVATGGDVVLQLIMGHGQLLTPSHLQVVMPDEMPSLVEGY